MVVFVKHYRTLPGCNLGFSVPSLWGALLAVGGLWGKELGFGLCDGSFSEPGTF